MDPLYLGKERIASLLPMEECIMVMEKMFRSLNIRESSQPLRSVLRVPGSNGLLGMMPGFAPAIGVMGIKVISVYHDNSASGFPSHQGLVILFDSKYGTPLMMFDATQITAIRTAAASALATRLLSRENSERLAIIGSGEQAERHIEAILLVREIKEINIWSRNEKNSEKLAGRIRNQNIKVIVTKNAREAVGNADIICTVTSSPTPVVSGNWIAPGTHINAVGSSTPSSRELDTGAILKSKLYTDSYDSMFNEAGDFLIPKKEGAIGDDHVLGDIGEVLSGVKKGRENNNEITIFKSLGIASEDIFSAWHIYQKINKQIA